MVNEQIVGLGHKDQQSAGHFEFFMRKYRANRAGYTYLRPSETCWRNVPFTLGVRIVVDRFAARLSDSVDDLQRVDRRNCIVAVGVLEGCQRIGAGTEIKRAIGSSNSIDHRQRIDRRRLSIIIDVQGTGGVLPVGGQNQPLLQLLQTVVSWFRTTFSGFSSRQRWAIWLGVH